MFKGSTAVINAQPGSRASLKLLWAPPCALPLWRGAVAPQPWCLWGGNNSPWLPSFLLPALGSHPQDLGKHLCFLPLWALSVAVLANRTPVPHQPHQQHGHGEGSQGLNIGLPSPWEHEMAQAALSVAVSSWHSRLYQSISNNTSSPGPKEIQV